MIMKRRLRHRLKSILERWIQQGAGAQLLVMVALIALVAVSGGLLAWAFTDAFTDPGAAIWWAFLRLTDPGYLGDDEGALLRTVSTIVTVLGYVIFMGSLIAILTQWLNLTMRRLESGLTPVSLKGHFLILGWTNRTPSIVRELALSEGRVRRFLKRRGVGRLRIAILAEEVGIELRQELKDILGKSLRRNQLILRSGSSMRVDHLRRVDFTRAAAIIIPGSDYEMGGHEVADSRVTKTLMSISLDSEGVEAGPTVVAEILDTLKVPIARQAYRGEVHVLSSDAFISRLIAQNVRHRGLSFVYSELLSHTHGNEVYVRLWPELAGRPFGDLPDRFPRATLLGVVRPEGGRFKPILIPRADLKLEAEDRLVMIARSFEDAAPTSTSSAARSGAQPIARARATTPSLRRILILGWNHKVPALVAEFSGYSSERFEIDMVSVLSTDIREKAIERVEYSPERVKLRHLVADYTQRADLKRVEPGRYDNVVFLGSDRFDSSEESDARTILGYLLLRTLVSAGDDGPEVLVELKDPENERLFRHHIGEVIISPVILSHMLAHAALRQELTSVFGELFGPGGAEIFFRPASDYADAGQETDFHAIQTSAVARGEIAMGVRIRRQADAEFGGVELNPRRGTKWRFEAEDEVVVLTWYR